MILDVSITEYRQTVTAYEVGLTRDRQTESRLRQQYTPAWFANPVRRQITADFTTAPGFQWYVDKYSEVTTSDPWNDIERYFQRANLVGRQGHGQPNVLSYPVSYPILNITAMASAAEALAGWYCETPYIDWSLHVRPSRVTPDMVFRDNASGRFALVEVKSSGNMGDPRSKLTTEMIKLLKVLAPTKLLNRSLYYVALIMVQVASATQVDLTSLVLEEV